MSQAMMTGHGSTLGQRIVGGRTASQGVFGGIAIVLGIVGLAITGTHPDVPQYLAAIAAIGLGMSLITVGASLAAAYSRLAARAEGRDLAGGQVSGATVDMFIGGAVIVLGVLALLKLIPDMLIPVQIILIGAGMMLNSAGAMRLATLEAEIATERPIYWRINEELVISTALVRMIAGVAVVVLGIIGVTTGSVPLALAALLTAGSAGLVNSTSLSNRAVGMLLPRS